MNLDDTSRTDASSTGDSTGSDQKDQKIKIDTSAVDNKGDQTGSGVSIETSKKEQEWTPDRISGLQKALQESQERLKVAASELDDIKSKQRKGELEKLDETERLKAEYQTIAKEFAELKLQTTVSKVLEGKTIPDKMKEMLIKKPWAFIEVEENATWEDVIKAVEKQLPEFVAALETSPSGKEQSGSTEGTASGEGGKSVLDTESGAETGKRTFTLDEIQKMPTEEYEKRREGILSALKSKFIRS